jgi:hypothetical protein
LRFTVHDEEDDMILLMKINGVVHEIHLPDEEAEAAMCGETAISYWPDHPRGGPTSTRPPDAPRAEPSRPRSLPRKIPTVAPSWLRSSKSILSLSLSTAALRRWMDAVAGQA